MDELVPPDFGCNMQLLKCRLAVSPLATAELTDGAPAARLFDCYSASAAVAWRLLRDAGPRDDDVATPRRFTLSDDRGRRIRLTLLNPHVALHTNQLRAAGRAAAAEGQTIDALRVLYHEGRGAEPEPEPELEPEPDAEPDASVPLRVLPEEFDEMRAELRASSELMPPAGRRLPIMGRKWWVGLLPVVPTWD